MNTIYYIGGISCAGKSTRVMALQLFLDTIQKSEPFAYKNRYGKEKQIGFRHHLPKGNLLIIGKFITRNGRPAWQGVDSFTEFLQEDLGQGNLYAKLWEWSKYYSLVLDASLMLRSPYSRPCASFNNCAADTYTWMFVADSVEQYAQRLAIRSTRVVTEESGMWQSNKTFARHVEKHNEELRTLAAGLSDKYIATKAPIDLPVEAIGLRILQDLAPEYCNSFVQFCVDNLNELHHIGALNGLDA